MITEEKFYGIKCDSCGQILVGYDDQAFWYDMQDAFIAAEEAEWHSNDEDKHCCPDCFELNAEKE